MEKNKKLQGAVFMALSAVLFSFGGLLVKIVPWSAFAINGVRCFLAALVFGLFLKLTGHKLRWNFPVVCGALCVCLTSLFFTLATKHTAAANAIILQYSCPIFVILLSLLLFQKKPTKQDVAAVACVFLGILWFFCSDIGTGQSLGNFLALCGAVACGGMYMMNTAKRADPQSSIFWGMLFSAAIGLPFLGWETVFTPEVLCSLGFMGILQFGVAYVAFSYGIKHCSPLTASLIGSMEPILNPIWVGIFYGEVMNPAAIPGAFLVLVTLIVYNGWNLRRPV